MKNLLKHSKRAGIAVLLFSYLPLANAAGNALIEFPENLPGGFSEAAGVNATGDFVVGIAQTTNGPRAYLWSLTTNSIIYLGTLPGGDGGLSQALAVSKAGDVVVGSSDSANGQRAFRWTLATNSMTDLGVLPGGTVSGATGVNAAGDVVVGTSDTTNGNANRAFRWTSAANTMTDLGTLPGGTQSGAFGVNAAGDVVVGYSDNSDGLLRAFRWTASSNTMTSLGVLQGGTGSYALATNAAGDVVVGASDSANGERAFRWTLVTNTMTDLGVLQGGNSSVARGVNALGDVVVGNSNSTNGWRGFRWTATNGMQSVEDWLAANGVAVGNLSSPIQNANSVSADGNVVVGSFANNRAYIARATPSGSGIIDVQDFNKTLHTTASAMSLLYGNTDMVINGLHGAPDHELLASGKGTLWITGGWDMKNRADGEQAGSGEIGAKIGIADNWQAEIALGRQYGRNDTLYDGKNTFRSTYVAPGISYRIPDTGFLVGLLAYYGSGEVDLRRGYLNAGLPVVSSGSPDIESIAARLRVDWLDAFALGPMSVTPYTSLTLSKHKIDSYTEKSGGFPVRWAEREDTAQVARFGVDNSWQATNALSFLVRAEYANRLNAEGDRVKGQIIGLNPFSLEGYSYQKSWNSVGVGSEYKLGNASTISATLNGTTQSDMPKSWLSVTYNQAF